MDQYIDYARVEYWRRQGWYPSDPARWTPGIGGREYLIWEGRDKAVGCFNGAIGYLDSIEGQMKPVGPLLQISRSIKP